MADINVIKDIGYKVLLNDDDGKPRQVLRCFVKEGKYGRFISLEKHWVQNQGGEGTVGGSINTNWARWSVNFPYDKEQALQLSDLMRGLIDEAVKAIE